MGRGEESSISRFNLSPESANGAAHSLADSPNGTDMRMRGGGDGTNHSAAQIHSLLYSRVLPVTILFVHSQFIHLARVKTAVLKSEQLFAFSLSRPLAA